MVCIYVLQLEKGKYYISKTSNPQFIDKHDKLKDLNKILIIN
jgi:hypothetical protein